MNEVTKRYDWCAGHYVIVEEEDDEGYRWAWKEPSESPDFSQEVFKTISEALRAAAKDWDDCGSGTGLSKNLRLAATQYEKVGQ